MKGRPLREMVADSLFFCGVEVRSPGPLRIIGLVLATVGAFVLCLCRRGSARREVGIRMALGARAPQVIALPVLRNTQTTVPSD